MKSITNSEILISIVNFRTHELNILEQSTPAQVRDKVSNQANLNLVKPTDFDDIPESQETWN